MIASIMPKVEVGLLIVVWLGWLVGSVFIYCCGGWVGGGGKAGCWFCICGGVGGWVTMYGWLLE